MTPFRCVVLILLFPMSLLLQGQDVTLNLFEPSGRNAMLPELYRANIINNSGQDLNCYLELRVEEAQDGLVGLIESSTFDVPEGTKQLNVNNYQQLEPVNVVQSQPEYEEFTLRTNTLPPGNYTICITVYQEGSQTPLDEDCYQFNAASFTPPYLLSPQDRSIVTDEQPFFTWSPSSPNPSSGSFSYTLLITEIHNSQSAVAAIQSNRPWLLRNNIYTPVFQYPVAARSLVRGSRYAWQVIAFLNGNEVGKSEVWAFTYQGRQTTSADTGEEEDKVDILPPTYHQLSKEPDGGYRLLNEPVLRFTYDNSYGAERVDVDLVDMEGNVIASNVLTKRQKPGINLNTINTSGTGVQREKLYKLKLTNGQEETYTMNFKIRKLELDQEDLQNIEIPGTNQ